MGDKEAGGWVTAVEILGDYIDVNEDDLRGDPILCNFTQGIIHYIQGAMPCA